MTTLLGGLKIDYWYKAILVAGVGFLVLSLTVKFQGIENSHVAVLSLGASLIGLGEWVNHPFQTIIVSPSEGYPGWGKLSGHPRKNTLLGNTFLLIGLVILGVGIYRLVMA
jgi:hypothetical protein